MTDDPYRPYTPTAVLPPDATTETADTPTDAPAKPFTLPPDFPVRPTSDVPTADAPTPTTDVASRPTDAATPTDDPNPRMVSLDVPIHVMQGGDGAAHEYIGDIDRIRDINTHQGDNPMGYANDCGLVSCKNILREFGIDATETKMVEFAVAHGLCDTGRPGDAPEKCGGTSPEGIAEILSDNGVAAHTRDRQTADDLAGYIQEGRGVVIGVNAGVLWDDPNALGNGEANHAITVIGVIRDPVTQVLQGFYINDTGDGKTKAVSVDLMNQCFTQIPKGGTCVVTDNAMPKA